jgi:DNA-binding transcriptional MocR family regulator
MFHPVSDKPQPGMGVFPPDWLETTSCLRRCARSPVRQACRRVRCKYGEPLGDATCAACWPRSWGSTSVHAGPEQIITTVGATHALDIVSRTLLRPGDR